MIPYNSTYNTTDNSAIGIRISSPVAKLITMMSRIEYPDFDIFELDELMSEKASVLIANEILKRVDFVRSGMIDMGVLRNFIVKVVDSYSRTNALYHNDLHAADVMQTLFTMMMRRFTEQNETWRFG